MSTVIKVENLSKQYRLGKIGTGTLSHDLNRWWHQVRGKEDPYLKISQVNDRTQKGDESEYVWALKDISFDIKQGDVVGIIGKNGAGKSTLLKILSRTTLPTTGSVKAKGRIASLLEVGTGFHPELTGRENIFLNGAILGMRKAEIKRKFDEIVDFAGVEKYIDTPVKRYSSGMYVRLAFAVAAHLEPEILIVDEVLAVGDAEFQKKALGKMQDVSQKEGRTVLFVSHNITAIKSLTKKGILMENGRLKIFSDTENCVKAYLSSKQLAATGEWRNTDTTKPINVSSVKILNEDLEINSELDASRKFHLLVQYEIKESVRNSVIALIFHSYDGALLFSTEDSDMNRELAYNRKVGTYQSLIEIPSFLLNQGEYYVRLGYGQKNGDSYFNSEILRFNLIHVDESKMRGHKKGAYFNPVLEWKTVAK